MSANSLQMIRLRSYELIWVDHGSRSKHDLSVYRPVCPSGYHILGDIFVSYHGGGDSPKDVYYTWGFSEGDMETARYIRPPLKYELVWDTSNTRCSTAMSIWKPIPPPGYVALGYTCHVGEGSPPLKQVTCIHEDVVEKTKLSPQFIWRDREGSRGDRSVSVFRVEKTSEEAGFHVDVFYAFPGHISALTAMDMYSKSIYTLSPSCSVAQAASRVMVAPRDILQVEPGDACPFCDGYGHLGTFGPCRQDSIHIICNCSTCEGVGKVNRTMTRCRTCNGKGCTSPFGPCDYMSIFAQSCASCNRRGWVG